MGLFKHLLRPKTNSTANDLMADVLGSKADTAATGAVTVTDSMMAYVKQLVTADVLSTAALGAMADSAATGAVGTTKSGMAYLKQLVTADILSTALGGALDTAAATGAVGSATTLMGYIKQIVTAEIANAAINTSIPKCIEKTDGAVLNATNDPLFTITGGPVLAQIFGQVTTVLVGTANGTLQIITTTPSATVALSTTVAIDNAAAGTMISFTGIAAGTVPALRLDTAGTRWFAPSTATFDLAQFYLPIGGVGFLGSAPATGVIKWYMRYIPLTPNAVVTMAA